MNVWRRRAGATAAAAVVGIPVVMMAFDKTGSVVPLTVRVVLAASIVALAALFAAAFRVQPRVLLGSFVVALAGGMCVMRTGMPTTDERRALERQGDDIIRALHEYRDAHGAFPPEPPDAAIALPVTRFGPWRYACVDACSAFSLHVGDYMRTGFGLWWRSKTGTWHWDT